MDLPDELASDLAELELELGLTENEPQYFTWKNADYPCVPGSLTKGRTLGSGGFSLDADLILFVRAELFTAETGRPIAKEKLSFHNQTFRIEDVVAPASEPFLKLVCVHPNRSA